MIEKMMMMMMMMIQSLQDAPPLFSLGAVPPKPVSEPMDKGRAASFRGRETKQRCCAQVRRGNAKAMAKSQNRGWGERSSDDSVTDDASENLLISFDD